MVGNAVYEMLPEQLQSHRFGISAKEVTGKGFSLWGYIKRFHLIFVVLFFSNIGAELLRFFPSTFLEYFRLKCQHPLRGFFAIILSMDCQCLKGINPLAP